MPKKSGKRSKNNNQKLQTDNGAGGSWFIYIDPERIRYQHARIRPYFSGCGRSVTDTLEEIRQGRLQPSDLPPIQVIPGPPINSNNSSNNNNEDDDDCRWYFSLNNRRLWVLKQCRKEGLLQDNVVRVRVRLPKSKAEAERYTLDKCALEAKFMRQEGGKSINHKKSKSKNDKNGANKPNVESLVGGSDEVEHDDSLPVKEFSSVALAGDERPSSDGDSGSTTSSDNDDSDNGSGSESSRRNTNAFSALYI